MDYETIAIIHRKGKAIYFFLKEGQILSYENIVDVEIHNQPERLNPEDRSVASDKPICDSLNSMET